MVRDERAPLIAGCRKLTPQVGGGGGWALACNRPKRLFRLVGFDGPTESGHSLFCRQRGKPCTRTATRRASGGGRAHPGLVESRDLFRGCENYLFEGAGGGGGARGGGGRGAAAGGGGGAGGGGRRGDD